MTVIRPNSIAGINSITVQTGQALNIHDASGNIIRNLTSSSGVSTYQALHVGSGTTTSTQGISVGTGCSIISETVNTLDVYTAASKRLNITSGGIIEVNDSVTLSSNAPSVKGKIRISGTSNKDNAGGIEFHTSSGGGAGYGSRITSDSSGNMHFLTRSNNSVWSERVRIQSDGDVGIGTIDNSNNERLRVQDDATTSTSCQVSIISGNAERAILNFGDAQDPNIGRVSYHNNTNILSFFTDNSERLQIASDGKLLTTRTHASSNTGNHPALDIDTYSNDGSPQAAMATGIDFSVEGVHKKRLAVTYTDSSAGTGDWIFYRDQGNNIGMKISAAGYMSRPVHPNFCARKTDTSSYNASDIIIYNDVSSNFRKWNIGGHYSTTTGKFTAPIAGIYYFEAQAMTTGWSNNDLTQDVLFLNSNNSTLSYPRQRRSRFQTSDDDNGYFTNSVAGQAQLAVGDTVWVQLNRACSVTSESFSYFTGWLVQ